MTTKRCRSVHAFMLGVFVLLQGCGGGGGGSTGSGTTPTATTPATPVATAPANSCSLRDRQDWVAAQLREWYLFPETLPSTLSPTAYSNVPDYLDALTATARAQRRDRYFTYLTSIKEEDAYYTSGSSAGFGFRLAYSGSRLVVTEAFEGTSALEAGVDRGSEIVSIGTSSGSLRTVNAILSSEGSDGLDNALGPDTTGTRRVFEVRGVDGLLRTVTLTKTDFELAPVSSRYGMKIITDNGRKVGYINLRTFITTADPAMRQAFDQFRAAGITDYIVDLRYNGGGLVSIAQLMGSLLGGNRSPSDVFAYRTYRPEKASENETLPFQPQPQSVSPTRIAFIGTGGTASASELVINAFIPYLHGNVALIGTNTYGKPVGQIALDRAQCDDRLRVIAFATQNSARNGGYFDGLAGSVEASCAASDDLTHPLGDATESSVARALDFLDGRSCNRISASQITTQSLNADKRDLLTGSRPRTVQREVPGFY